MLLASLSNISKKFDEQLIFENASLAVKSGEKIGLVGSNGAGKTTLFAIIGGELQPDSGSVDRQKGLRIGRVAQELNDDLDLSIYDFCFRVHREKNDIRLQLADLEDRLAAERPEEAVVNEFHTLVRRYEELGGYALETEIRVVLEGIGFSRAQIHRPLSSLSGGERNRAQIAATLTGEYDLFLLDEPTNHLDIQATIWLENHIAASRKAYVIISHDRRFLNNTVNEVAQLSLGKLELFHCSFNEYVVERQKRLELAEHYYRHQAEEIARIEDFIRRNIAGQKTKQAQSKQKYLDKLKRLERPRVENEKPLFRISDGGRSFLQVLKVENLAIGYGGVPLVRNVSFEMNRGDRVGLIGANGSGKTTLLKTLGGLLEPLAGDITVGGNVDVTYFDQELSNLNLQSDVISELWEIDPLAESGRLRSFLARFGFSGEDVFKPVSLLSGGEKTKLSLAKILYRPANLMIFDEPTNHLDMVSIEALEEGLAGYNGTLLVVSHDRDFLDKTVNQIFEIEGRGLNRYLGNYSEYAERRGGGKAVKKEISQEKKQSYENFKEKSREKSRYRKRLEKLGESIKSDEKKLAGLYEEEKNIDGSNWERLHEIAREVKRLEDKILNQYIEKEQLEREPPDA